jgi:hypothetical protein
MEEHFIRSQGPQRTVSLEKKIFRCGIHINNFVVSFQTFRFRVYIFKLRVYDLLMNPIIQNCRYARKLNFKTTQLFWWNLVFVWHIWVMILICHTCVFLPAVHYILTALLYFIPMMIKTRNIFKTLFTFKKYTWHNINTFLASDV